MDRVTVWKIRIFSEYFFVVIFPLIVCSSMQSELSVRHGGFTPIDHVQNKVLGRARTDCGSAHSEQILCLDFVQKWNRLLHKILQIKPFKIISVYKFAQHQKCTLIQITNINNLFFKRTTDTKIEKLRQYFIHKII